MQDGTGGIAFDEVVVEEPLEIRVNNESLGVTMRTPGNDFDLTVGLLRAEGIIVDAAEIGTIAYCPDEDQADFRNVVNVTLTDALRRIQSSRKTWASSGCGLCGEGTLEAIRKSVQTIVSGARVDGSVLAQLPSKMRKDQANFSRTGGIHAAALFEANGRMLLVREDLGRHNAVDKLLGAALTARIDVSDAIMLVSGRLGFEIAQKAAVAAIPIVASVSAPSSLALELAAEIGMTTVGFVRDGSLNIYTHAERVINGISEHPN